jgi:hypothetical protein
LGSNTNPVGFAGFAMQGLAQRAVAIDPPVESQFEPGVKKI